MEYFSKIIRNYRKVIKFILQTLTRKEYHIQFTIFLKPQIQIQNSIIEIQMEREKLHYQLVQMIAQQDLLLKQENNEKIE